MDASILILRLIVGLYVFAHGTQKLFGWFAASAPANADAVFTESGLRPAKFWASLLGITEAVGAALFATGLLSPLGSIWIGGAMLVSVLGLRLSKGLFEFRGGIELPLTNLAVAVAVGITGPGLYSIDAVLGITLREFRVAVVAMILAYLVVVAALTPWLSLDSGSAAESSQIGQAV
ncbi:MAG: DoxX family protein [Candidatus Dormibacter sp.]